MVAQGLLPRGADELAALAAGGGDAFAFDLRVPGVTSISVDLHKYGFASKGASCVVYRDPAVRRAQYTTVTDWPGGLYATAGVAGSRGGGVVAAAWATLAHVGAAGYRASARRVAATHAYLKRRIAAVDGLRLVGAADACIVAFTSDVYDIYKVADEMESKGWDVPRMQRPPCVHVCVMDHTHAHADKWLADLAEACRVCRDTPAQAADGLAGIYGQAAIMPDRSVIGEILAGYLDTLLKVEKEEEEGGEEEDDRAAGDDDDDKE